MTWGQGGISWLYSLQKYVANRQNIFFRATSIYKSEKVSQVISKKFDFKNKAKKEKDRHIKKDVKKTNKY